MTRLYFLLIESSKVSGLAQLSRDDISPIHIRRQVDVLLIKAAFYNAPLTKTRATAPREFMATRGGLQSWVREQIRRSTDRINPMSRI